MDLSKIDFINGDSEEFTLTKISLPDELPKTFSPQDLPPDILKSSTVENLISQNQDLMNRLAVALRRLAGLENENQKICEDNRKTQLQFKGLREQIAVLSERENSWSQRLEIIETEKHVALEKARILNDQTEKLQNVVQRHERYQEKIRTQVKPYIAQLKEYTITLEEKVATLEKDVSVSQAQVADIRAQIIEVTTASRLQIENETKKYNEMIQHYEEQVHRLHEEVALLKEASKDNDIKTLRLQKALERQDYLENEVVQVTRSKEEIKYRLEKEMDELRQNHIETSKQNQRLGMEHADLQVRVLELETEKQNLAKENFSQKEQLESLRYMWSSKNEENDKLRSALEALEKLNIELSSRLNELRNKDN